ncbi:MAG: FAD:protein FMN transferase [Deltaproteobacteria bacterium]|jgi:thiamine biosynthesis lipoprotein|nr:FAD:protein FMN transferase [Deltaproteobacteria bacterium]
MRPPGKHPATECCGRYSGYYFIALVFILSVAAGCGPSAREVESFQGSTMGTTYSIKYVQEKSLKGINAIKKAVDTELEKINSMMSTWDPESNLSLINKADADQWLDMPSDLSKLIGFAFDLSRKTDGKYDVSMGPLINLWGFGPGGARKIPTDLQIAKTMKISGYDKIELNIKTNRLKKRFKESYIDLSSIAKGYGVDKTAKILEGFGIKNYMVEIGGEIKTSGKKQDIPWRIAIESPRKGKNKTFNKVLNLVDCAMATSGDYRNFFKEGKNRYSHTIDSATGRPVQNDLASVTVAIPNGECFKADAWATALMASGKDRGMELATQFNIPAHFIYIEKDDLKEISTKLFIKEFL